MKKNIFIFFMLVFSLVHLNSLLASQIEEETIIETPPIKKYYSAGGIIVNYHEDEWKYLAILQERKNGELQWVSPKGQIEKEETSQMAAVREINEETGLKDLTLIQPLGSQVFSFSLEDTKCEKVVDWYLYKSNKPTELLLNKEEGFIGSRWLNYLKARDTFTHPSFLPFLEKINHFLIKKTS